MIQRTAHVRRLTALSPQFPIVALLGPRQVGKTTLARQFVSLRRARATFFDLESPEDLALLADTMLALRPLIESHPKVGASWEGFACDVVVSRLGARPEECFFWATHSGAALDLLVVRGTLRLGFEFKRTTAPAVTRSMRVALEDLGLAEISVIHAGSRSYDLDRKIRAIALSRVLEDLKPLR